MQSNSPHDYRSTIRHRSARVSWLASDRDGQFGVIEHQTQLVPIHRRRWSSRSSNREKSGANAMISTMIATHVRHHPMRDIPLR